MNILMSLLLAVREQYENYFRINNIEVTIIGGDDCNPSYLIIFKSETGSETMSIDPADGFPRNVLGWPAKAFPTENDRMMLHDLIYNLEKDPQFKESRKIVISKREVQNSI